MSTYYKYNFVSPQPLIALVKEELKSYFDTQAIDDLLFPKYIDKCLQKLGRGSYTIKPAILRIEDYQSRLPDDYSYMREAWMCANMTSAYQLPNSQYQQAEACSTSTRLDTPDIYCDRCNECEFPDIIRAVYKTTNQVLFTFQLQYLLKPANINAQKECNLPCANYHSYGRDSYDIHDNKFTTTFREGTVYIDYYSKEYDCEGYQLIPDNYRIQEYIEAFLKQKMFEQLSNQVTDESYNQIEQKAQKYKAMADEAYIIAQVETKKETIYDKRRKIINTRNRFNRYNNL